MICVPYLKCSYSYSSTARNPNPSTQAARTRSGNLNRTLRPARIRVISECAEHR